MNCREFSKHYQSYIDGELDNNMVEILQQHIERCPRCNRMLQVEKKFKAVISRKVEITSAPRELHIKIQTKLF